MISKYNDFINESKINLLLEANMVFEPEFLNLLKDVKSPFSDIITNLNGKELDVNTNYITYSLSGDDKILFRPDDKVEKNNQIYRYDNDLFFSLNGIARNKEDDLRRLFNINTDIHASRINYHYDVEVESITEIDQQKLHNLTEDTSITDIINLIKDTKIVLITFTRQSTVYFTLADSKYIFKDKDSVKESEISVGRFIRSLLKKSNVAFTDKDIENFVTEYKTTMRVRKGNFLERIDIVKGDAIKHWYNGNNNEKGNGTLGNSCMNGNDCEYYFEIYCENPNQVSLIIMYSEKTKDDEPLICARALLWTDNDGRKFMDRIYTQDSSLERLFIEYAIINGFSYKKLQNFSDPTRMLNGVEEKGEFTVFLDYTDLGQYPYLDTLKYYYKSMGALSSSERLKGNYLTLEDTEGGPYPCEDCDGTGTFECYSCGGNDECRECEGQGDFDCNECSNGKIRCKECDGEGESDGRECDVCEASGKVECVDCGGTLRYDCDSCNGRGSITCNVCYGNNNCPTCDDGGY